jgi:hypothetical protein
MQQRFRLDPRRPAIYLALGLGVAGCYAGAPGRVVPAGAAPTTIEQVRDWVAPTAPTGHHLYRFTWRFRDELSSAGGRGSVRIAAPDTLRFDVAGPLGAGKAAALLVNNEPQWVEPRDAIEKLVPNYPLMWALFGVAQPPPEGAELRGLSDGRVTAWQYVAGADTVEYARTAGPDGRFTAEVRQAGKVVGRVETRLNGGGDPVSSRLTVPSVPARLDITFTASTRPPGFPSETWTPPQP